VITSAVVWLALLLQSAAPYVPARGDTPPFEADEQRTITFSSKLPAVGAKYSAKEDMATALTITAGGQTSSMEGTEACERRTEILAVKDGVSTKLRVLYARHEKAVRISGKDKVDTSPVAGKTYVVERKGDDLVVTDANGRSVSSDEAARVKSDHESLGKPEEVSKALRSKPRKVGERLDDVAQVLADRFKQRSAMPGRDMAVDEAKLLLSGVEKIGGFDHAVLDLSLKMSGKAEGSKLEMSLGGKVFVRIDEASFGEVDLRGPIAMTSAEMTLKGTFALKTKTGP
jgi:hypothetical protein